MVRQTGVRAAAMHRPRRATAKRNDMANEPLPVTGAWQPGDPAGTAQFLTFATDHPFAVESGAVLRDVTIAYETWGTLNSDRLERRARVPRLDGRLARRRTSRRRSRGAGVVGRRRRPGQVHRHQSTGSWCAPTCSADVRVRPDRRRRTPTTAFRTARASRCSRSATWFAIRRSLMGHLGIAAAGHR